MCNFNKIPMKPMIFKNMSSNFLPYTLSPVGHTRMYPVAHFTHENRAVEKPMLRLAKLTTQGELLCPPNLPKNLCCVCRRCLPLFLSVKAHGGQDAKAGVFPGLSKSARALLPGEARILSRCVKRFSKAKPRNELCDDAARGSFIFRSRAGVFPKHSLAGGTVQCPYFFRMPRGP